MGDSSVETALSRPGSRGALKGPWGARLQTPQEDAEAKQRRRSVSPHLTPQPFSSRVRVTLPRACLWNLPSSFGGLLPPFRSCVHGHCSCGTPASSLTICSTSPPFTLTIKGCF